MLKTRLLTALIGIPLVLLIVWQGGIFYTGVVMLLALLALRELVVTSRESPTPVPGWLAFPLFLVAIFLLTSASWGIHRVLVLMWLVPVLALIAAVMLFADRHHLSLNSIALTLLATSYVALFGFLILLRFFPHWGGILTWSVLLAVWAGDSAAYFGGKTMGRKMLTPLSPKKTVEGTLIGFAAALIVGAGVCLYGGLPWKFALGAGALIALTAPLGDLMASYWKREMGAKDFGALFPGHGGVLDRCDSLMLAAFAMYFLASWML